MAKMLHNWSDDEFSFSSSGNEGELEDYHYPPANDPHLKSPPPHEVKDILSNLDSLRIKAPPRETSFKDLPNQSLPSMLTGVRETRSAKSQRRGKNRYINQYLLLTPLGKGMFGSVRLAKDVTNNTTYAIKIINKSILRRKRQLRCGRKPTNMLENVIREIAIMKKLDHPNVVKLIEVIDDPQSDKMFLVLELVGGGSVASGTAKIDPIEDVETTRRYFRDMILGVDYLHRQNIMHADIQPENLLIGEDGHIKIGDFGVSVQLEASSAADSSSKVSKVEGTPAFVAPEATVGGEFDAFGIDVWSMGVTLYMFVTGVCPFAANSLLATYEKIVEYDPPIPSEIDPRLQDVLRRILEKNPKDRITIDELMHHEWVTNGGSDPLIQPSKARERIEVNEEEVANAVHRKFVEFFRQGVRTLSHRRLGFRRKPHDSPNKRTSSLTRLRLFMNSVVDNSRKRKKKMFDEDEAKESQLAIGHRRRRTKIAFGKDDEDDGQNQNVTEDDDEDEDDFIDARPFPHLTLDECWSEPVSQTRSLSTSVSVSVSASSPRSSYAGSESPPSLTKSAKWMLPRGRRGNRPQFDSKANERREMPRRQAVYESKIGGRGTLDDVEAEVARIACDFGRVDKPTDI